MLVFWQTLTPFSAMEQRRKRRRGRRQEFALYAASSPLTRSPYALWHRQSCWLCYCWLLTNSAWAASWPCLSWMRHPKNKGLLWCTSLQAALPAFLTETGSNGACCDSFLPAAISSSAYSSHILTRLNCKPQRWQVSWDSSLQSDHI